MSQHYAVCVHLAAVVFLFTVLTVPNVSAAAPCANGWTLVSPYHTNPSQGRCLRVFGGIDGVSPITWPKAEEYCNQFPSGHLATINSIDDALLIVDLAIKDNTLDDGISGPVWIGLSYSTASNWAWQDGSPVRYLRWWFHGTYPSDPQASYPAGYLHTRREYVGTMNRWSADHIIPFVCQSFAVSQG